VEKQLIEEKRQKNGEELRKGTNIVWGIRNWQVVRLGKTRSSLALPPTLR
jgi:hypothetical protein